MKHLFQSWDDFSKDIKAASHIIILSDYDGTLTPIVSRPEEAILSPEMRERLLVLAGKSSFSVGVVSGRPLSEVRTLVGIEGIFYAGNHGLEIEGPGISYINPQAVAARTLMKELAAQFTDKLSGIMGTIIEDKTLSLSIHYRLVNESEERAVNDIFRELTAPLLIAGKIRVSSGKKVLEIRPPIDWDKGKAVESIRAEIRKLITDEVSPVIYLGDDTTDEDAFKVINRPEGWSIFVGPADWVSRADYFLDSTSEVETFLFRLAGLRKTSLNQGL